jgi:DNA polymerase III subunit delta'
VLVERERDVKTEKLHGTIVLDQVHALTGRLALGSFMRGHKVAVIDAAHLLTIEAANALLKTLEEPRPKTTIILLAPSETAVLPTLKSRCQIIRFGRVEPAEIAAALAKTGVPAAEARLYAGLSGGLPGKAVSLARDPAALKNMYALRDIFLAMPQQPLATRWHGLDALFPAKMPLAEAGDAANQALDVLSELLHDAFISSAIRSVKTVAPPGPRPPAPKGSPTWASASSRRAL